MNGFWNKRQKQRNKWPLTDYIYIDPCRAEIPQGMEEREHIFSVTLSPIQLHPSEGQQCEPISVFAESKAN